MALEANSERSEFRPRRLPRAFLGALIAAIGGAITAMALVYVLSVGTPGTTTANTAGESNLAVVGPSDIASAAATLTPASASQLATQAKECSVPLAYVTIASSAGAPSGTIRIQSGNYLSPAFVATESPQRIAIPFPSPYATGRGVIAIVGDAKGLSISLLPTWKIDNLVETSTRTVTWRTDKPC